MYNRFELKKLKTDIENLCNKIMESLDIIENSIKSSNFNNINKKISVFENTILEILLTFENFTIFLSENENYEIIHKELVDVKGLLSVLRCCVNSVKKDYDDIGIILICDLIYDKCEKTNNYIKI